MPLVETKDFNALINNKPFFNQPVKTNKKHMENVLKCQEMPIQQEMSQIICIMKIINSMVQIYLANEYEYFQTNLFPQNINSEKQQKKVLNL